eukprot:10546768-Alexandrium_andersonii.AAC.1
MPRRVTPVSSTSRVPNGRAHPWPWWPRRLRLGRGRAPSRAWNRRRGGQSLFEKPPCSLQSSEL